jgi:aryl sulfotransferase
MKPEGIPLGTQASGLPVKRRELHNHHMDATSWNGFPLRDGDIFVGTYGKAGTTRTRQIVAQMLSAGDGA